MEIFDGDFEGLYFVKNSEAGLRMIIGIHDTTLGDALGGIRFYPYVSEEAALVDVQRLARGMTYKNAIIYHLSKGRLSHGGGKAVIIGNSRIDKTPALLHAAAGSINDLGGKYIGGEDMGMTPDDIELMFQTTKFITGLKETHSHGIRRGSGDPSPITALGVFEGIRECLKFAFGDPFMKDRTFAMQGIGSVGRALLNYLSDRSPKKVIVTDVSEERLRVAQDTYQAVHILPSEKSNLIYDQPCDVFIPCAIGGILNDQTIERLSKAGVRIVAGCANNQLLEPRHGEELAKRKILYAPDYVINAGGAINVAMELDKFGYNPDVARNLTKEIGTLLARIFRVSVLDNTPPEKVADRIAQNVLQNVHLMKKTNFCP